MSIPLVYICLHLFTFVFFFELWCFFYKNMLTSSVILIVRCISLVYIICFPSVFTVFLWSCTDIQFFHCTLSIECVSNLFTFVYICLPFVFYSFSSSHIVPSALILAASTCLHLFTFSFYWGHLNIIAHLEVILVATCLHLIIILWFYDLSAHQRQDLN